MLLIPHNTIYELLVNNGLVEEDMNKKR